MNTEDLIMAVTHDEALPLPLPPPLPSGQQVDSNMLEDIPEEEEDAPSSDDSRLNEEDHGQPQQPLRQLSSSPSQASPSSPAMHVEHRARHHDKHRRKHSNGHTTNHPINQTQGSSSYSSKLNLMRLFIMAATLAMTSMLLIAVRVRIQNEKQNIDIMRREAQEFHQSARETIRQAEHRRDMRQLRRGQIEQFVVS